MTAPSRGTALYAATLVTIGAAAGVRFFTSAATAVPTPPAAPPVAAPVAATSASSPSPTDAGSTLAWGRGPHPSATASSTPAPTVAAPTIPTPRPAPTTAPPAPAPMPAKPAAPAPAPAALAAPATAVVVGSTVQTRYGPVQVSVTFTGGTLTAVRALQSPSGGYSSQVSAFALPVLSAEAVAAGSASITTVSGASYTSAAYRQSLQYAIDHRG